MFQRQFYANHQPPRSANKILLGRTYQDPNMMYAQPYPMPGQSYPAANQYQQESSEESSEEWTPTRIVREKPPVKELREIMREMLADIKSPEEEMFEATS